MKRRGGVVLALATIVVAALASTAGAGSSAVAADAGDQLQEHRQARAHHAAHGRRRLHRPGAALVGQVRREDPGEEVRAQGAAPAGRHTGREGPGEALVVAQKFISDPKVARRDRPGDLGRRRGGERGAHRGGHRADLAVGDPDVADEGREQGGDERASSASSPATTSRGRPTRTTWSTSSRPRRSRSSTSRSRTRSVSPTPPRPSSRRRASASRGCRRRSTRPTSRRSSRGCRATPTSCSSRRSSRPTRRRSPSSCSSRARRRRCSAGTARTARPVQGRRLVRVQLRARTSAASPANKALIDGWKKDNPSATLGSFGPPDLPRRRGRAERDQEGVRRAARARSRTGSS